MQLYRRDLGVLEWVVKVRVYELQVWGTGNGSLDRVTSAIINDAEECSFRTHSDGRDVAQLELSQRVQHKSTYKAGSEVKRIWS